MFEIGEKVVYGVLGVCEITDIATPPIKGIEGSYYFLQPVYDSKGIIYSPVDSNTTLAMRDIVSEKEAEHLMNKAKNCKADDKDLRKLKSIDSRMLTMSRKLLYGELAVALNRELADVTEELDTYLGVK